MGANTDTVDRVFTAARVRIFLPLRCTVLYGTPYSYRLIGAINRDTDYLVSVLGK